MIMMSTAQLHFLQLTALASSSFLSPNHSLSSLPKSPRPPPPPPFSISSVSNHHHHPFPLSPPPALPPLPFPSLINLSSPSKVVVFAGRSKKKPGGPSPGRIEGNAQVRRQAKARARVRSRRLSENLFYRRKRAAAASNYPDSFTEDELHAIGLGYDRAVRFLSEDDPDLKHPYDWYKYGRYGPYSWRGIVVGPPIRGRFSDDRVTLMGEVRDHEEWEEIEQFEMFSDYCARLDKSKGLRYYWVFVRHPKWRPSEIPVQQWTLVAEVAMEAGQQWLDKWNLMARLGNRTRSMIGQCAAWFRPDIIYVKKPVFQSRFEPQDDFFKLLGPLLDPKTENEYPCELRHEDGRVDVCTYFGGLCKIVKINQKAYVDDVVKAYQKLSEESKSLCLEFLLTNHPMELLHPYTKEWKAKLEEQELGCDAQDDSDDDDRRVQSELQQVHDWVEEDEEDKVDEGEMSEYDEVIDVGEGYDEVIDVGGEEEEDSVEVDPRETPDNNWNNQWKKALSSSEEMEKLVKKSMEISNKRYKQQIVEEQLRQETALSPPTTRASNADTDNAATAEGDVGEWSKEEPETEEEEEEEEKREKNKAPPGLFLRASVRPFTYRNLVKEIVLMRHAIIDGDIASS